MTLIDANERNWLAQACTAMLWIGPPLYSTQRRLNVFSFFFLLCCWITRWGSVARRQNSLLGESLYPVPLSSWRDLNRKSVKNSRKWRQSAGRHKEYWSCVIEDEICMDTERKRRWLSHSFFTLTNPHCACHEKFLRSHAKIIMGRKSETGKGDCTARHSLNPFKSALSALVPSSKREILYTK